jgi:hypothetical protein
MEISKTTEKRLNQIQFWGLRLFLQVGPGTPLASLLWDTAILKMDIRVKIEKILLVLHIRSLKEDTIAKKMYLEQISENWPGLASETKLICEEWKLEDCNITSLNRDQYKKVLIQAGHIENEKYLRGLAKGKCERISVEEYGRKPYIQQKNIFSVRQQFRTRFGLQPFAGNFSNDRRFAKTNWLCKCKQAREEELHLVSGQCPVYGDLTHKFSNLTDDNSLVQFFQDVLARREELDKLERSPVGGANTDVVANSVSSDRISQSRG